MKAYIFGPINLFGQDYLPIYKELMSFCKKYFDELVGTYPDFWNSKESPKEFYNRTYKIITTADLFIGEISSPSMGVGMEFQMAQEHGIPCIALCKKQVKPSAMILGIPCTKHIIYYENLVDLKSQLDKTITNILNPQSV